MIGSIGSTANLFPPRLAELNRNSSVGDDPTATAAGAASTSANSALGANAGVSLTNEVPGLRNVQGLSAPSGLSGVSPNKVTTPTGGGNFGDMLSQAVGSVNGTMQNAEVQKARVLSGDTNNLHQAMISMQEANVAFSLMTEVRNKMVESYQEIMKMQV